MADLNERFPENVNGPFYVDKTCIACLACVTIAPEHFRMVNGNEHSSVFKQPETEAEKAACDSAVDYCPVNAIGKNGQAEATLDQAA